MKRKVIQIADSTQLVSLPRKWAVEHGVKKGDEVEVTEEGNKIVIEISQEKVPDENLELDISELDKDSLIFLLRGLFIRGYEGIKLVFRTPVTKHHRTGQEVRFVSVIHGEISRAIGYEITQERGDFVMVKRVSQSTIKEFDAMLKRIFLLILDAAKDLSLGVKNQDFDLVSTLEEKHNNITKFIGYTLRILYTVGYTEYNDTPFMFHIISSLDMIIDILRNTARDIVSERIVATKDGIHILEAIEKAISHYHELYYKFSFKKCEEFSSARDEIITSIKKMSKKLTKEDIRILTATEQVLEVFRELFSARIAVEY